jgi:hypothetical protein
MTSRGGEPLARVGTTSERTRERALRLSPNYQVLESGRDGLQVMAVLNAVFGDKL